MYRNGKAICLTSKLDNTCIRVIIVYILVTLLLLLLKVYRGVYNDRWTANPHLSCGYFLLDERLTHGHPLQRIIFERVPISNEDVEPLFLVEPVRTRSWEVLTVTPSSPTKVDEKPSKKQVLKKKDKLSDDHKTKAIDTSVSDELLLRYVVQAEAGNTEDLDGCRLVCDVILNRVMDAVFPNTVEEVIFQPGQFQTVKNLTVTVSTEGTFPDISNDKVKEAVRMELSGNRLDTKSLYFARSPITSVGVYQHGRHFFSR